MKIQATDQKTSSVESKGQKRKIGSPKKPRLPVKRKVSNITNLKIGFNCLHTQSFNNSRE